MTTDELRSKTETEGLWMMQVMCNQDIKRICDGTCNDPCCMQKHPPTTYALQAADEVRAKFEEWYPNAIGDVQPFECYEKGYASRDAEVEALRKDAERYRWLRSRCTDEFCVRKGVPQITGAALDYVLDAAMREESK